MSQSYWNHLVKYKQDIIDEKYVLMGWDTETIDVICPDAGPLTEEQKIRVLAEFRDYLADHVADDNSFYIMTDAIEKIKEEDKVPA